MAEVKVPVKPVEATKQPHKRRVRAPENESKADRFRRIANNRVPRALKLLRSIGMLGNKSQYEAKDEQISAILQAVQEAYAEMKSRLYGAAKEEKQFRI